MYRDGQNDERNRQGLRLPLYHNWQDTAAQEGADPGKAVT